MLQYLTGYTILQSMSNTTLPNKRESKYLDDYTQVAVFADADFATFQIDDIPAMTIRTVKMPYPEDQAEVTAFTIEIEELMRGTFGPAEILEAKLFLKQCIILWNEKPFE